MLLYNSLVDDNQQFVSVIASTDPSSPDLNVQSSKDEFLASITYNSVASVISQCDQRTTLNGSLEESSVFFRTAGMSYRNQNHNCPRKAEYDALTLRIPSIGA